MTLQDFFTYLNDHKPILLLAILFAPWLALGVCIVVPGKREEPLVLSFNLGMAVLSLLILLGYVWFATQNGGWSRVVQEADILLMTAPFYYVGISFWVAKQRLPLEEIPVARAIKGLALIGVAYLGISWFLSKIRILAITFIPLPLLLLFFLMLVGLGYLGYLKFIGADDATTVKRNRRTSSHRGHRSRPPEVNIDEELDTLRRQLHDQDS
ncbi:MAG: hypothetical protein AAGE59_12155 [Cyanobacteria bacterium P01_F01_bin.86]